MRDKQIEEMAREICSEYDCVIPCQSCGYYRFSNCRDVKSAEKLYNAGYRKSTDVAEEIFAEIVDTLMNNVSDGIKGQNPDWWLILHIIAELKKKYTQDKGRDKISEFGKYSPLSWRNTEEGQ